MSRRGNSTIRVQDTTPGPWERWRGSRHGRAIRFIQTYVRSPRGVGYGKPLRLLLWQKEWLEAVLADDVTAGGLVMGRGGGKSTLLSGVAAWAGFADNTLGAPVVPIVAASLAQARSAVYGTVVSAVNAEPELANRSLIFSGIGTERIIIPRSEGSIFPRSAEPDTLQGLDLTLGLVDEWGHLEMETWNAVLMGRKRRGSRVIGAGTPGPDRDTPLYHLRRLVREGSAPKSFYYREFSGEPGAEITDEANWQRANPSLAAGFPDIDFLRNAAALTPEPLFRTYHLAEFDVVGHDSWLGPAALTIWDGLRAPHSLVAGQPTWIGVDIGWTRDSTAVVAVQRRPDGRLHAVARIWMPTTDQTVDITDVMAHLRDLARSYDVQAVSYDPRMFELPAKTLADEGLPMVLLSQSAERMTPIVGSLFELIHAGGLTHDDDPVFAAHVVNAVPRLNERGYTLSKSKSAPRGHIDACIALALAVDRALHPVKTRPPLVVLI